MSELPPRDSFVAEVAYIALRDELNLEITSLRAENSRLSALAGKMREVGNRILAAGQGTDYPDSRQALREALSLTPVDMGEWGRKEELERLQKFYDMNIESWKELNAKFNGQCEELSTLRAKLAEVEKSLSARDLQLEASSRAKVELRNKLAEVEKERDDPKAGGLLMWKSCETLQKRVRELETALRFYAEIQHCKTTRDADAIAHGLILASDCGKLARQALAKKGAE